jgi:hypothetical protein
MPPRLSSGNAMALLGDRLSTATLLKDLVLAPQSSFKEAEEGQHMIPPHLRKPNASNSWELLQLIAQERQQQLQNIARQVRSKGGTTRDVQDMWEAVLQQGKMANPGDFIRGSGLMVPRQGARVPSTLVLNPTRQIPIGRPIPRMPSNPMEPAFMP